MTLVSIVLFILLIFFVFTGLSLAPWVPTQTRDLKRINTLAGLGKGNTFIEIGCGDAKVCHFIAKKNPNVTVIGVEINPIFFLISQIRALISPQKNLTICFKNGYTVDFSRFDVVYVFGMPARNAILGEKLWRELKVGAKVISYTFEIKDWKGKITKYKENPNKLAIYVYEK